MGDVSAHVSVIIPTYNRLFQVCKSIESVLAQSYKNYEIIVIDDGSTDGTGEHLKEKYGSLIRYYYQKNKGPAAARNKGINQASHDLIAFLDSDDIWLPEKLERQLALMSDMSVVLSYTNWKDHKEQQYPDYFSSIDLFFEEENIIVDDPVKLLSRTTGSGISTITCMARKSSIVHVGCFDERMKIAEDVRLWHRLGFEGKYGVLADVLSERGWSDDKEHLSEPLSLDKKFESARNRLEIYLETYARAIEADKNVQDNIRYHIQHCLLEIVKCQTLRGNFSLARRNALEAFICYPKGKYCIESLIAFICPQVYKINNRQLIKYHE